MKALKAAIVVGVFVYVFRATLVQFNQFLDPFPVQRTSLTIQQIGVYYQPLPVQFLQGSVPVSQTPIRVSVLSEIASAAKIGEQRDVVIGRGLFLKPWADLAEKHAESSSLGFKILYLGLFAGISLSFGFLYFRGARMLTRKRRIGIFSAVVATAIAAFYAV